MTLPASGRSLEAMAKIVHCSDLHLAKGEEADYGFSVLDEVVALCGEEGAAALLLAGDVFDSRADLEALKSGFRTCIDRLPKACAVYMVPGNHEELAAGATAIERHDFGRARLIATKPFELVDGGDFELLAIPFSRSYDHSEWQFPAKAGKPRVVLAHGTVSGLSFSLDEGEEKGGVIDPDLFSKAGADYAAMGHIHSSRSARAEWGEIAYPGSARVWRRGEEGPRKVFVVELAGGQVRRKEVVLEAAGRYRVAEGYSRDGVSFEWDEAEIARAGKADWVALRARGYVEDEAAAMADIERKRAAAAKRCRKAEAINETRPLAGISENAFARDFLAKWAERAARGGDDPGDLALARELALDLVARTMEARR